MKALKDKGVHTRFIVQFWSRGRPRNTCLHCKTFMELRVTDKDVTKYTTDDPKFVKGLEKQLVGSKMVC